MSGFDQPTFDRTALDELGQATDGDNSFLVELIETYLADAEGQVEAIDAAIAATDAEALVRPAHTLKSSSASVGAMRLAAMARGLEAQARAGQLADAPAAAAAARLEWGEVSANLRALAADLAAR
jgi:HPt (histidine-containing phosphotransfer) domain-containing protein